MPSNLSRDHECRVLPISAGSEPVQNTIRRPVQFSGCGLFHGLPARVTLLPAEEDQGIRFRRTDLAGRPEVPAHVEFVAAAPRRTVLSGFGARVETVEHLMAALAGLGIDNCTVEIDAPEVPSADGSCLPFCEAILEAGLESQSRHRRIFFIREAHAAGGDGGERIELTPLHQQSASVCYQLNYPAGSPVPGGSLTVTLTPEEFLQEIAGARTFIQESEIEMLQRQGFGRHLTASDIVIFAEDGSIPDNQLRWADEPVRHKILDCIGDLALCGVPFVGQVIAQKSGHKLNHVMAAIVSMMSGRSLAGHRAA